jgi:DNA replication and repair protein RecF
MNFTKLSLINFRNHTIYNLELKDKKNNIYGSNGTGKTSIIEAIEIISYGKSLSSKREKKLINSNASEYNIKAVFIKESSEYNVEIKYNQDGSRKIYVNDEQIKKVSEYINNLQIIKFSPNDMFLLKSDQVQKRKYIDIFIAKTEHNHLINLQKYNSLLKQKNKTLKEIKYYNRKKVENLIKVLNFQITKYGIEINKKRAEIVNLINEELKKVKIQQNEIYQIKYNSDLDNKTEEKILNLMEDKKEEEIKRGYSIYGIQRDKIDFMIDDQQIDTFCSQGQKRSFILILKKIESDLIKKTHGFYPLALLDDALNELDEERKEKILNLFKNNQIITTSTQTIKDMKNIKLKEQYDKSR